jgi:hypothetical protein
MDLNHMNIKHDKLLLLAISAKGSPAYLGNIHGKGNAHQSHTVYVLNVHDPLH